jgi:hypothetical protein
MSSFDVEGGDLSKSHRMSQWLMTVLFSCLRIDHEEEARTLMGWYDLVRHL